MSDRETECNLDLCFRYDKTLVDDGGVGDAGDMNPGWLKREVEKSFSSANMGMSVMDMCSTIFDLLCSPKSDSALQNDVSTAVNLFIFLDVAGT